MFSYILQRINYTTIVRVLGWFLLIESLFLIFPAVVSLFFGEYSVMWAFVNTFIITLTAGCVMSYGFPNRFNDESMRKREAILITSTVWIVFSAFGMLPFLFSGVLTSVTDAFFETMSGFTTTGASVLCDVESLPRGIVFWRSMCQWIGGMGIILFTLAVLPMLNFKGGVTLFTSEVTGISHERITPRVSQTAKLLWGIYFTLTIVCFAALMLGPMDWFDSICHAMSTVSTGGFSTKSAGLDYWHDYYSYIVIIVFMAICGINFSLIYLIFAKRNFSLMYKNVIIRCYLAFIVVFSLVIFLRLWTMGFCDNIPESLLDSVFDTVSAITSTGFSTYNYERSGQFIFFLLLFLMFFGGMAGSTSGGAKVDRFVVTFKNLRNEIYRVINPNSVRTVRLTNNRSVPREVVDKVLAFLAIYVFVIITVAILRTAFNMPAFDAMFNSLSAISNIGFGYGEITAGASKFSNIPSVCKWVLALEMMVGRLEIFTVLAIFTRGFWIKR